MTDYCARKDMHYFSGKGCSEFLESMHYCIGILNILGFTPVKVKNGYKSSIYAGCSHSPVRNDWCCFFVSSVLVFFIMLRISDFEINS